MIFGAKIQITLLSKIILLSNFQTLWKRSWIIKLSPCWPVFVPQRVGTGLPPVTKKKSVEHWPLKSGGLMSKVSKSMRICNAKWKKGHPSMHPKKNLPHYNAYLANFIIESVYHQVADSLWALRVGKVGGIFWCRPSAIELNYKETEHGLLLSRLSLITKKDALIIINTLFEKSTFCPKSCKRKKKLANQLLWIFAPKS